MASKLARGITPHSVIAQLYSLWGFVASVDESGEALALETSTQLFKTWTEGLLHQVRIVKDLSEWRAYSLSRDVADAVARAQGLSHKSPGSALMRLTRIRVPRRRKRVLGTKEDRQNLEHTFEFGHFLADLCCGIDAAAVRGPLPLKVPLRDGRIVLVKGGLKNPTLDPETIRQRDNRRRAIRSRAPLEGGVSAIDDSKRSRLFNLRIEAELLIFVAQTGMNLGQAAKLVRENYRWQSDGEDLQVFRVHKGRRGGDAVFRCYKAYRDHWKRYLKWLEETGLADANANLFPFLYPGKIPASYRYPSFKGIRDTIVDLELEYVGPRVLRNTRVNWLLRRSRDPELTAEQAAHSKQTLLKNYEQPHHQSAAAEILRFHMATDPTFSPPGPGICVDNGRKPVLVPNAPPEVPLPDCISPEGCLFCVHHRDVMSADYCWKLASHARLKGLEVSLYKPTKKNLIHPGNRVIDRIQDKLRAIGEGSDVRAQWVRDAQDAVRAGRYHPTWDGHIQLIEVLV